MSSVHQNKPPKGIASEFLYDYVQLYIIYIYTNLLSQMSHCRICREAATGPRGEISPTHILQTELYEGVI